MEMDKATYAVIGVCLTVLLSLFAACSYSANLQANCRLAAMNNGYSAVDIQAICK